MEKIYNCLNRLGHISTKQFQIALDRFNLGKLIQVEPVRLGFFEQNVFLYTTKGNYVLRGSPLHSWQFPKEVFFSKLLHEKTEAPIPWPYLHDPMNDIFGWDYVIMPLMPGISLISKQLKLKRKFEDNKAIAWAMGRALYDLHELKWSYSGIFDRVNYNIQAVDYKDWFISSIYYTISITKKMNDSDIDWVMTQISKYHEAIENNFQPCFVMMDFGEHNVVATNNDGKWHISGIFDYMPAYFGDGEADFSRIISSYIDEYPEIVPLFLDSYIKNSNFRPNFEERFILYMLKDRLLIWQHGQNNCKHGIWWDKDITFKEWIQKYIRLDWRH